jgi:polyisoprenoid-binding protein YceI
MNTRRIGGTAVIALVAVAMVPAPLYAVDSTYYFGVSGQRTNITFESATDFEIILGSTNMLSGWVRADFKDGTGEVSLSVPVDSLRTGIDLRDEHMRSPMWLDAGKYPEITFTASEVRRNADGVWQAGGTFTLHGVSREISVPVEVREIPADLAARAGLETGDWLRVSASFPVKLSDFGVKIPDMAAAKVNDTWNVRVLAFASTVSAKQAVNPCNPCGGKASVKKAVNPCNPCGS